VDWRRGSGGGTGVGEVGVVFEVIGDGAWLGGVEFLVFDFFELDHCCWWWVLVGGERWGGLGELDVGTGSQVVDCYSVACDEVVLTWVMRSLTGLYRSLVKISSLA